MDQPDKLIQIVKLFNKVYFFGQINLGQVSEVWYLFPTPYIILKMDTLYCWRRNAYIIELPSKNIFSTLFVCKGYLLHLVSYLFKIVWKARKKLQCTVLELFSREKNFYIISVFFSLEIFLTQTTPWLKCTRWPTLAT